MSKFQQLVDRIPPERKKLGQYGRDLLVSIEETMGRRGITQEELARRIEMNPSQFRRLLSDLRNYLGCPSLEVIARLSVALETELLEFPVFEEWSDRTFGVRGSSEPSTSSEQFVLPAAYVEVPLRRRSDTTTRP